MKELIITALMLTISLSLSAQDWVGRWEGTLVAGTQKMKIVFNIKGEENGELSATMDSPDQMAFDIKMDKVVTNEDEITISFSAGKAQFIGAISEDKQSIKGNWVQGMPFPLELKRSSASSELKRPQSPKGPFPYKVEEVSYKNKEAGNIKLAGTLTLPKGEGRYPAVILISGSGPQDRDESIAKHKPFWVIADYLSRNGYAVLRFDDRGVGASEGDFVKATTADFATDVSAGIEFLKTHKNIDAKKIGLMGHSEGGMVGPMVTSKDKSVAFLILLAGPGIPCHKVLLQQQQDILEQQGIDKETIAISKNINTKLYEAILKDKKNELGVGDLMKLVEDDLNEIDDAIKEEVNLDKVSLRQGLMILQSPWMRYFLCYNPEGNLKKTKCPVLAINGDKDLQVAGKENLEGIETALNKGKNKNVTIKLMPNLNHLFQTTETGAISEYAQLEETFSPDVLKEISTWLNKVCQ